MFRRLAFGSLVILIRPGLQNMITFAVASIALVVTREYSIHYDASTDMLAYVASIQILMCIVALMCQVSQRSSLPTPPHPTPPTAPPSHQSHQSHQRTNPPPH